MKEPWWLTTLSILAALAITAGFLLYLHPYQSPGPGDIGIDENAYLVGGKQFAAHGTPALRPSSPYAYVGPMWIVAPNGAFYPKYPVGVPLLNAIAIWIGHSPSAAYWVSPICGAVSVLAIFLLVRAFAGSICGLFAAIWLATNPSILHFSLVPSSHAPDVAFALLGMAALLYWWRRGWIILGIIAGLCIGFTVSIRYSEGLLLAPLGIAALLTLRFHKRSLLFAAVPVIAWCVPFFALLIFNRLTMGHWTGYDTTNESTGFSGHDFADKWQYTIQQLNLFGVFFLLPLGVLGMLLMLTTRHGWKLGLVLLLWFIPSTLLYMAYYWGRQMPGLMYLRFFVSVYPPIIAAAAWLIGMIARGAGTVFTESGTITRRPAIGIYAGAILFTAMIGAEGIFVSQPDLKQLHHVNAVTNSSGEALLNAVPALRPDSSAPPPLMFGEDVGLFSRQLMHFQFIARGEWFSTTAFTIRGGHLLLMAGPNGNRDPNDPSPPVLIQKQRLLDLGKLYYDQSPASLAKLEAATITNALTAGREAYAILQPTSAKEFQDRLTGEGFQTTLISTWHDPGAPILPPITLEHGATTAPANSTQSLFAKMLADKKNAPPPPPPFGGDSDTLELPAVRFPRMFDTASDLEILKITRIKDWLPPLPVQPG